MKEKEYYQLSSLFGDRFIPLHLETLPTVSLHEKRKRDRDRDGIEDSIDLHLGTNKVALNHAQYRQGYERIKYPMGDVKRDHGVCTDVIIIKIIKGSDKAGFFPLKIIDHNMTLIFPTPEKSNFMSDLHNRKSSSKI